MGFTPEQRAKAAETRRRNAESRKGSPAVAVAEPVADDMSELMRLMGESIADGQREQSAEEQVLAMLSKMDPSKHKDLFKNPTVQAFVEAASDRQVNASDVPPGTVLNPGSVAENVKPWTMKDILETFPIVEFTPHETKQCFFDGVMWQFVRRQKVRVPKIFVDLYEQSEDAVLFAEQNAAYLFGNEAPTSPDMVTPEAARVRGMGKGTHFPGGGYDSTSAAPAAVAA